MKTLNEGFDALLKNVIQESIDNPYFELNEVWDNMVDEGDRHTLDNCEECESYSPEYVDRNWPYNESEYDFATQQKLRDRRDRHDNCEECESLEEDADAERLNNILDKGEDNLSQDDREFIKELGLLLPDNLTPGQCEVVSRDGKCYFDNDLYKLSGKENLKDLINKSKERGDQIPSHGDSRHHIATAYRRPNEFGRGENTYLGTQLEINKIKNSRDKRIAQIDRDIEHDIHNVAFDKKRDYYLSRRGRQIPNLPESLKEDNISDNVTADYEISNKAYPKNKDKKKVEEDVTANGEKWKQGKDVYDFERRSRDEQNSILKKGKKWYTGEGTIEGKKRAKQIRDFGTGNGGFYDAEDYYKDNLSNHYADDRREHDHAETSGKVVSESQLSSKKKPLNEDKSLYGYVLESSMSGVSTVLCSNDGNALKKYGNDAANYLLDTCLLSDEDLTGDEFEECFENSKEYLKSHYNITNVYCSEDDGVYPGKNTWEIDTDGEPLIIKIVGKMYERF